MNSLKGRAVLVIAPHPDDEVIGCAGFIQTVKSAGGKIYVLFMTIGDTRDFSEKGTSKAAEREREIERVAKFLKYDDYNIAFRGNKFHLKLDLLGQIGLMNIIERDSPLSLEKIRPDTVIFPSPKSYNQDHRITALAAHASLRPADRDAKHYVPSVLAFEELADNWTLKDLNVVNFLVPLTDQEIGNKLKALQLYKSQYRAEPNMRSAPSLKALAALRGTEAGCKFAEGYYVHRMVNI